MLTETNSRNDVRGGRYWPMVFHVVPVV